MKTQIQTTLCVALAVAGLASCDDPPETYDDTDDTDLVDLPPPCSGAAGRFSEQPFTVDGSVRYYFLYVPASYTCDEPMPILLDFHGTGSAPNPDTAIEELYALQPLLALADQEGFIVLRPRSMTWRSGDTHVYQWDAGVGHLQKNRRFAELLLQDLGTEYHLGPLVVFGFSNGTNMATQMLGAGGPPVFGLGTVGGGYWSDLRFSDLSDLRVWSLTGYRDYMLTWRRRLESSLPLRGVAAQATFVHEVDAGHDLYGWHYRAFWRWIWHDEAPLQGAAGGDWIVERSFGAGPTLLEVDVLASGRAVAVGEGGAVLVRDPSGVWSTVDSVGGALTGLCVSDEGALAVGETALVRIVDGADVQVLDPIDDFGGYFGGDAWMNGVACSSEGRAVAGGYWNGAVSEDLGDTWEAASVMNAYGSIGQLASLDSNERGTWVGVGYYYLGRSEDGVEFSPVSWDVPVDWLTDVHAGPDGLWWASGDGGTVRRSTDDGETWRDVSPPSIIDDLYAVAFRDDLVGIAVGASGAAAITSDGGESWADISLDSQTMLAGVTWLDDGSALVVGAGGLVLRLPQE